MHNFNVPKDQLLEKLKENRAEHREVWEEALQGFRDSAIAKLTKMLDKAKGGKKIQLIVGLKPPEDHTSDYDRIIGLLEFCTDTEIELTEVEYAQYVQDDWGWKDRWTEVNTPYSNKLQNG